MAMLDSGHAASLVEKGRFSCPQCRGEAPYRLFKVRRALRVGGVPVLPWRAETAYVECGTCKGTFIPDVLEPAAASWNIRPLHHAASLRVMLLMMLADGAVEDAEIQRITELYASIGGEPLRSTTVRTEAEHARADRRDVEHFLADVGPRLNEHGKLAVLRCAWEVANADGNVHDDEKALFARLVRTLEIRPEAVRSLGIVT